MKSKPMNKIEKLITDVSSIRMANFSNFPIPIPPLFLFDCPAHLPADCTGYWYFGYGRPVLCIELQGMAQKTAPPLSSALGHQKLKKR